MEYIEDDYRGDPTTAEEVISGVLLHHKENQASITLSLTLTRPHYQY